MSNSTNEDTSKTIKYSLLKIYRENKIILRGYNTDSGDSETLDIL